MLSRSDVALLSRALDAGLISTDGYAEIVSQLQSDEQLRAAQGFAGQARGGVPGGGAFASAGRGGEVSGGVRRAQEPCGISASGWRLSGSAGTDCSASRSAPSIYFLLS